MKIKILLLVIVFLLTATLGAFGYKTFTEKYEITPKETVLGEQKVEPTLEPTVLPTITPTPTPTPKPTFKSVPTNIPIPTSIPKPQKAPVYLPHNGQTVQCNLEGVDAVKNASENIVKLKDQKDKCDNDVVSFVQECVNKCTAQKDFNTNECMKPNIDFLSCQQDNLAAASRCLDSCKAQSDTKFSLCPSVNQTYYDSLNSLLNTYCK